MCASAVKHKQSNCLETSFWDGIDKIKQLIKTYIINWFDFNPLQSYNDPYLKKSKNQLRNKKVKLQNLFFRTAVL